MSKQQAEAIGICLWQWNMTAKLGFQHKTKKFTDSSKMNLKASSLWIENKNPSVALLHHSTT
jgi:hypothetical protein